MSRHDSDRVKHILEAAHKAMGLTVGLERSALETDEVLSLALVRLLEIVGEAAASVPAEVKARFPDVPWQKMVGLRNRLIHGYFDINLDIVWETIRSDLPFVVSRLEKT
ncbi:MAG: hypothetical protein QOI63_729 [Thermoplasmata archaeon]|nr:hypothetical protein [Thermoplasmata archaeon]